MKATLTVNKADLREKLMKQRESITAQFESSATVKTYREALAKFDGGETVKDYPTVLIEWHQECAKAIEAGSYGVGRTGNLTGLPAKPKPNNVTVKTRHNWAQTMTKEEIEFHIKTLEDQLEDELRPITTAIELLDMSAGTHIEIDASNYQELLSGSPGRRYRYW